MRQKATPAIEWYCHEVGKGLKCGRGLKNKLLGQLENELSDDESLMGADTKQLAQAIGEPEAVAHILLDSVPVSNLLKNNRRKIAAIVLVSVALLVVLIGVGLIILSGNKGIFVRDKSFPTKEETYRTGFSSFVEKEGVRASDRARVVWGMPDFSRESFDCWKYKDAYLIIDYDKAIKAEQLRSFHITKSFTCEGAEIIEKDGDYYKCLLRSDGPEVLLEFCMSDVLIRQDAGLVQGDRITIDYTADSMNSRSDETGQEVYSYKRILCVYKEPSINEEKEGFINPGGRSIESSYLLSTGVVSLFLGTYFLFALAIFRLLKNTGYKKTWHAWIPFFNLVAAENALRKERHKKPDVGGTSSVKTEAASETQEIDQDGLLGYISIISGIEKK
ncbi:MAG: hypothetical protein IJM50_02425 [Lachnospiraceae bacterium]|nr:hypothetical protein [Lachnospiraceae bacterium]